MAGENNILGGLTPPADLLASSKPEEKKPVTLRAFGDVDATRKAIYDSVFDAASSLPPVSNKTHTLSLTGVQWVDPDTFTKKQRKDAILGGHTLGRRLKGTWQLTDNASGKVLDKRTHVLFTQPHLTEGGTFVHNGTEYSLSHQQRLRPGIYTREQENGLIESHVNVLSGGPSHKIQIDPAKGVFHLHAGQANIPLLPLMTHLGATEDEMREAWGPELYARNYSKADGSATPKIVEKFLRGGKVPEGVNTSQAIQEAFAGMKLDPEVNQHTLGQPFANINKDALLATTKKLLAVSRGEVEPDDRDHLAYQTFLGPEDLFKERLAKDRAGVRRQLLYKSTYKGHLQSLPSSPLQHQIDSALLESGLGRALEEVSPAEVLDKNTQTTRMGEGGIGDVSSVPLESRNVHSSQLGFIDLLRTPESAKAGIDVYLARNARKGSDGKLYAQFTDPKSGQPVWKTPQEVSDAVLTTPDAMNMPYKRIPAMRNGKVAWLKKDEVGLTLPSNFEESFSPLGNMVPLKSMVKGQRIAMASRMITQALPLVNAEAPFVQTGIPGSGGTRSYEQEYGKHMGAIHADKPGRVLSVTPDKITVRHDDGTVQEHELHQNLPYNRKTSQTQTPVLQPGASFRPGQLLAKSNFTDHTGTTALGKNARVAFMSWGGANHEDANVISESFAKRLTSQHTYQHQLELSDKTQASKNNYISQFPGKYDKATLANHDANGIIKPGTKVKYGDPLILATQERSTAQNKLHKKNSPAYADASITWEHHDGGVVTDVVNGKGGPVVVVASEHPTQLADKLSGRYGNKGVIGKIIPDAQMPHDDQGKAYEILLDPLGMISRVNPGMWAESKLGAIAAKTGQVQKVEDFDPAKKDMTEWVLSKMRQHGIPDTQDVYDPVKGTKIPGVHTGNIFVMKLHHTAEGKAGARSSGAYSSDDAPAKGGDSGAKRLSTMETMALLAGGNTETLRDAGAIRGQKDEDYQLAFMQGNTPSQPKVPLVYEKFMNELRAAGISPVRRGSQTHLMALTDKDVDKLAGDRNIKHSGTVNFNDELKPVKGGLFDPALTGSHHGLLWSAVKLHEPMPNPAFEEPIRRMLGLTQKKFEAVISGQEPLNAGGATGPQGISDALKKINVDREILISRAQIASGTKGDKDKAIRKLGYLKAAKRLGIHPSEWVMNRVPVLPPKFRPINVMGNKNIPLVSDSNFLYKELVEANNNLGDMKGKVGDDVGNERLAVYHAFKAVAGLGEPITQASRDKEVRGILKSIAGSSPKFGSVNRKLISSTVDNVGRAVITPNPDLDMDQAGLPEDKAFDVYTRFIARRLKRSGMPLTQALKEIKDRTPLAKKMLNEEMEDRPVIISRAPVLHKFGIMAFRPQLVKGSAVHMPPLIFKGLGMDADGDAVTYHVPVSEEAKQEALERMLPSKQLISPADFKTPMHTPGKDHLVGLYQATTKKSDRSPRVMRNIQDLRAAWEAGEINIGDAVRLLEQSK